jgi:hypothetical protein
MNLAKYDAESDLNLINDPSPQQLQEIIALLNNEERTVLNLHKDAGTLSILGGNAGRVVVSFHNYEHAASDSFRWGKLIDTKVSNHESEVEISVNGTISVESLRTTVSKDVAVQVVNYYLANGVIPDGLIWEGRMR